MNKKRKIQIQLLICALGAAVVVAGYFIKQSPLSDYEKTVKQLEAEGVHQNPDGSFSMPASALTEEARQAITNLNQKGIPITHESFAAEMARAKSNAQPAAPLTPSASGVIEHEGGFAYALPPDWVLREVPDASYKMVFGRESDGSPANISFTVVSFDGDLGKFESTLLAQLRAGYPSMGLTDLKVINMSAFTNSLAENNVAHSQNSRSALLDLPRDDIIVPSLPACQTKFASNKLTGYYSWSSPFIPSSNNLMHHYRGVGRAFFYHAGKKQQRF
jgi:hypothetical protein